MSSRKFELHPEAVLPSPLVDAISTVPRLDRVSLPEEYMALLAPSLTELKWDHQEDHIDRVEFGSKATFYYTLVSKGDLRRALLYLRDEILTQFSRPNKLALMELREVFYPSHKTFYVFHDSQPNGAYRNLMVSYWLSIGVTTKFIAMSDLYDFQRWALEEQTVYVRRELDLDADQAEARRKIPAEKMDVEGFSNLTRIIANLPSFITAERRRGLIETAGLTRLLPGINLEGSPQDVAFLFVNKLLVSGGLGGFLVVIRGLADMPITDQNYLTEMVERYDFR